MLLKSLHHDPEEVQHMQQFTEALLAEDAMPFLLLKYAQGTALHCTDLHTHTHTHSERDSTYTIYCRYIRVQVQTSQNINDLSPHDEISQ